MRKTKTWVWAILITIFAGLFLAGCSANAPKVGIVDIQKVMSDSPKVKQFQEQLNTKGKELSDQLEKDKKALSQEEFQKKQETLYAEFMKFKQDLETQIDNAVKQALEQVAKEKKVDIILYKNSVAQGGIDISDDVIQKMK